APGHWSGAPGGPACRERHRRVESAQDRSTRATTMDAPRAAAAMSAAMRPDAPATPLLRGRRLALARAAWVALVTLELALFVASVPALYRQLSAPPEAMRAVLDRLGLSIAGYAVYLTALQVVGGLGCFLVAAAIFRRRSDEGMALFGSLFLVLLGAVNGANAPALEEWRPSLIVPVEATLFLLMVSLILFPLLFPDGRFVPRWVGAAALVWSAMLLGAFVLTGDSLARPASPWWWLLLLGGFGAGVAAQVYRYVRVSGPVQRQQTKWVVFGAAAAVAGQAVFPLLAALVPSLTPPGLAATPYDPVSVSGLTVTYALIPLT